MTTYTTAIADSDFRTIMFLQMCTHGSLPSRTLNTRMCMYMYIYFYLHVCVCCLLFLRTHTTHVAHTQTDMVSEHSLCDKLCICGFWTNGARFLHTHTKHMAHCTHKKNTMAHFTHSTHMASCTKSACACQTCHELLCGTDINTCATSILHVVFLKWFVMNIPHSSASHTRSRPHL